MSSESSAEAMSERELQNAVSMATGILEKTAVSKYETLGALSHALLQTHTKAAELREELRKTSAAADSLLQGHMIPKDLQGKYTAGPGTDGKDIIVCERCGRYVTEQVEGILETRSVWETENAELRERAGELERILGDFVYETDVWNEEMQKIIGRQPGYCWRTLEDARAALSPKAKLENQEEEGVIGVQKGCGWCGRTPSCQICQSRDKLENQEEK